MRRSAVCKHYNATVQESDLIGYATCPDCKSSVNVSLVFNNWLKRLRRIFKKGKQS